MSLLDEALERQLRKLVPLPKAAKAPEIINVPAPSQTVVEGLSVRLAYQEGSSDKVYNVQVDKVTGGYMVRFEFGRRGKLLQKGCKNIDPLPLATARNLYDGVVRAKMEKGYRKI